MSEKPNERIKLVVCNEPQNCGTVKELESRLAKKLPVLDCLGWANCEKEEQVYCRFSIICQKVAEYQVRLAETETSLKIANEGLNATNKISDELQERLAEAEKELDNPPMYFVAIDYETREEIDVYPLHEVRDFMDRLKSSLRREAEEK